MAASRSRQGLSVAGSLRRYRQKRDFTTSPEPTGLNRSKRSKERFFCIQKHLASHLHYDLRLEHRGVLISWAVPKGPSLDPRVKRLAMRVEDHPLDYGTFEGVIPSGYGAGIVVLWDRGVWKPLVEDVDEALHRGKLPFLIVAKKISGAWNLVRANRAGEGAWLLVKQRDEWASTVDVTLSSPGSIASAGDFAEVLARERRNPWSEGLPVKSGPTAALYRAILASAEKVNPSTAKRGGRRRTHAARSRRSIVSRGSS